MSEEIVQNRRDTKKQLLMRLFQWQRKAAKWMITDKLQSHGTAKRRVIPHVRYIKLSSPYEHQGRVENRHQYTRLKFMVTKIAAIVLG
ncbi:hypothetical protein [Phyllobacterium myrsinacearum]|uniref:DDE domain-containing protein n=1 Tax=Phyllobacterium myrsinacearum TaxID=28101 RepID=A0A839ERA1_9HYPH|nr:hypothetical protein [Phyllobacterium myrsinacearum]MBA8879130.1 hypothetical protein [Phyllobacterium myrsinacearum]